MRSIILILFIAQGTAYAQDTLNIMSWNIFQRPRILSDHQKERISPTIDYLIDSNCDVLVLQEVFHKKTRSKLVDSLKSRYPYSFGPGKGGFFKINSGVMIFSRYQMKETHQRVFKAASGVDKRAKKSGLSVVIELANMKIQIIATHLQAEDGIKKNLIRRAQIDDLVELKDSSAQAIIYAGDFNIEFQSHEYGILLDKLNALNDTVRPDVRHTSGSLGNPLFKSDGAKWIDFILLDTWSQLSYSETVINVPKYGLKLQEKFISDHNPIRSSFILNNNGK